MTTESNPSSHGRKDSDLARMQQRLVDDTVEDTFPASDPPSWTTTGSASVAAQREREAKGETRSRKGMGSYMNRIPGAFDQGRETLSNHPLLAVAAAGAAGFGLAWLLFGRSDSQGRRLPAYGRRPMRDMDRSERRRAEAELMEASRAAGAASGAPDSF
ncbi:MAG TPA: hypothetical protein VIL09_00665 [Microvirga sp.]|jgi:hypothetical protein